METEDTVNPKAMVTKKVALVDPSSQPNKGESGTTASEDTAVISTEKMDSSEESTKAPVITTVTAAASAAPVVQFAVDNPESSSGPGTATNPTPTVITEKTALRRFFNPPNLERKHSSGDLHSRLKTRKMLGVGETDNGDIHRSKISQVLGHNDHLYLKLPRGYWNWQLFLSGILAAQAAFVLIFPKQATEFGLVGLVPATNPIATQYYGATMLALSFLLWKFLNMKDKGVTRAVQCAALIHFVTLCLVDILYAILNGIPLLFGKVVLAMLGFRVSISLICLLYLSRIGAASSGLRRSPSYKDLMDQIAK